MADEQSTSPRTWAVLVAHGDVPGAGLHATTVVRETRAAVHQSVLDGRGAAVR